MSAPAIAGFFGEIALIKGTTRTATCVARTFVDCFVLDKETLDIALDRFPEARHHVEGIVDARLRKVCPPLRCSVVGALLGRVRRRLCCWGTDFFVASYRPRKWTL